MSETSKQATSYWTGKCGKFKGGVFCEVSKGTVRGEASVMYKPGGMFETVGRSRTGDKPGHSAEEHLLCLKYRHCNNTRNTRLFIHFSPETEVPCRPA